MMPNSVPKTISAYTIIYSLRECAADCSKAAAEVKKECEALHEAVKDFIVSEKLDMNDFLNGESFDGVEIMLKDDVELTFDVDASTCFFNPDNGVYVTEPNPSGLMHCEYRDDFVDNRTGYIRKLLKVCDGVDWNDFVDELNDAGELLYYSLLKTALTVAKERMAKWNSIDHTVDDDECVECAE